MAKPLPYTKKNDEKQDRLTTKGLNKAEKAKFEKMDKKHRKPKNQADDTRMDKAIVKKIKKK
jgi:hypothetical protein